VDNYQTKIDKAANDYNRTKDEKYKKLWYNLIRKVDNGSYNFKRRTIPTDTSN
jgi:very-short-patch-repair endonuclease